MINLAVSLPWWDSLDSVRKVHSDLEAASIVCFALLVAFDSAAHILDKNKPDMARLVAGTGLVFFWLAVAAEIVGYKYGQRNDELSGEQISSLDAKASDAAQKAAKAVTDSGDAETKSGAALVKAGRAQDSAGAAHTENEVIKKNNEAIAKEQESLTVRLATASSKLGEIEHKVRVQSPRGPRLEAAKAKFIEVMKPFAGQLYTVVDCGDSANRPAESLRFENDLVIFLGPEGAGWKPSSNVYREWPQCSSWFFMFGSNFVIFDSTASKEVEKSAVALAETLNALEINTMPNQTDLKRSKLISNSFFMGTDSPGLIAGTDPTGVVILVLPNPMFDEMENNHK
jgi:hypothetical protein